jgi:hypothetical protein
MLACMASFGEVGQPINIEVNNESFDSMAFDTSQATTQQHSDACEAKSLAEVPVQVLNADDRRAMYAKFVTAVDCVKGKGYEVGTMVSVETFVAKGDTFDGNLTSRWAELSADDEFRLEFFRCQGVALSKNPSQ